jgi:undecaprenyl-diphosphatase
MRLIYFPSWLPNAILVATPMEPCEDVASGKTLRAADMRSRILDLDRAMVSASVRICSGEFKALEFPVRCVSRVGDGYLWIALLIVALFTGRTKAGMVGLAAAAIGIGASLLLKNICRRARPLGGPNWARYLAPDKYSFPSGHTTTAFALATVTASQWTAIAPVLWICAGCIAISRTLLGCHYLSDVLAGVGLGVLSGLSALLILT